LSQNQRAVALLDAHQALKKAFSKQVHFARLRRENESLNIVQIRPPRLTLLRTVGEAVDWPFAVCITRLRPPEGLSPNRLAVEAETQTSLAPRVDEHPHRSPVDQDPGRILAALVSLEQRFPITGRFALRRLWRGRLVRDRTRRAHGGSGRRRRQTVQ
jgi:hypothetical protein